MALFNFHEEPLSFYFSRYYTLSVFPMGTGESDKFCPEVREEEVIRLYCRQHSKVLSKGSSCLSCRLSRGAAVLIVSPLSQKKFEYL